MFFKVSKSCILYGQYINELSTNFKFDDRIKKICQMNKCKRNDLNIEITKADKKLKINIGLKTGEPLDIYDFSDIKLEDLSIVPKSYHASNINKYITKKTAAQLKVPLSYDYFWINDSLYLEVSDTDFPIEFRMLGVKPLSTFESIIINNLRNMIDDLEANQ